MRLSAVKRQPQLFRAERKNVLALSPVQHSGEDVQVSDVESLCSYHERDEQDVNNESVKDVPRSGSNRHQSAHQSTHIARGRESILSFVALTR